MLVTFTVATTVRVISSNAQIPSALIDAIKEQRAVLFLGAGASQNATHPKGDHVPLGDRLRDLICDKFLSGELKNEPLNAVASVAANEVGLADFQMYVHEVFNPFSPTDFHMLIPNFRWRAIATTNFDLIVEKAYRNAPKRLQNLVKTVKDGDNVDARLNKETDPVCFYKLHGCIEYYADSEIPLILGNEQFASYETNRTRIFGRFRDLGFEHPIIFAGHSISEPHIQRILFDLTDPQFKRPHYYILLPGISGAMARYWAKHRVHAIDATFEDFIKTIDQTIPALARAFPIGIGGGELSIRNHYRVAHATRRRLLQTISQPTQRTFIRG